MTVVTVVTLKEGAEPERDAAMRDRLEAAKEQPGWLGGQLLMPVDRLNRRAIIGTGETRAHWEAWHNDPRVRRDANVWRACTPSPPMRWYEVVADEHP